MLFYRHVYKLVCGVFCRYQAECSISIVTDLFPQDHLLLASSKRVKGSYCCHGNTMSQWLHTTFMPILLVSLINMWMMVSVSHSPFSKEGEPKHVAWLVYLIQVAFNCHRQMLSGSICWTNFILFLSALILEEIAIDCYDKERESKILQEAQDLHLSSLDLARYIISSHLY